MKKQTIALILCLFVIGACAKPIPRLAPLPASLSCVQDVLPCAAKAAGILRSTAKLANTVSKIEDAASRDKIVPPSADAVFDRLMVAYADKSDAAMKAIVSGVDTWAKLKALVDPVIVEVQRLIDMAQTLGAIKDQALSWLTAMKDVLGEALGEYAFGGAR